MIYTVMFAKTPRRQEVRIRCWNLENFCLHQITHCQLKSSLVKSYTLQVTAQNVQAFLFIIN